MTIHKKRKRRTQFEQLEHRHLLTGFTAYNAIYTGLGANEFTTGYGDAPGADAAGPLRDVETGEFVTASVSVSAFGASFGSQGNAPHPDTDAGQIFAGFVDFAGGNRRTIEINDDDVYSYTFENLDEGALYDFTGTAVRGNANYTNRWTLIEIEGADSFEHAHSGGIGILRTDLADNQVVLWGGDNTRVDQGFVAQWVNIDPGSDGMFSISSKQYTGAIPAEVNAGQVANGNKGYGLSAFRLSEQTPLGPPEVEDTGATDVQATSAMVNGKVTNTGGQLPEITIYYGTTDGGTNPAAWENSVSVPTGRTYGQVLDGLQHSTTYYFRSFGQNGLGSDWANSSTTFTTLTAAPPLVTTLDASNVGGITASLPGRIDSTGNDPPVVTVFYGQVDGGTDADAWQFSIDLGVQSGSFQAIADNLSERTGYYFNVRAQNNFGTNWGNSVSFTTTEVPELLINEFMADNADTLTTRVRSQSDVPFVGDSQSPDWIEIRNTEPAAASLNNHYLTDDIMAPNKWKFPDGTIVPGNGFLLVFASGFNILNPDLDERGALHTSFQLNTTAGNDLLLVGPEGQTISSYVDMPGQVEDISYGVSPDGISRYFADPSPGEINSTAAPPAPNISLTSQTFTDRVTVEMTAASPSHTIHYTIDERTPTSSSPVYTGPLEFTTSTNLRAISVAANGESSLIKGESYIRFSPSVADDESHLPILIVETFGDSISESSFGDNFVAIIEPGADGISTPADNFDVATRAGVKIRGSSSSNFAKKQYRVEFRDEQNEDRKLTVLGMPQEADWIFYGPSQYDRNLISNPLMYDLSNQLGRYATRTRWVEAYFNGRYNGVYAIVEVIERDDDRVDVEPLTTGAGGQPVEGGFIWKNDRGSAYVDPENLNANQRRYVDGYIDDVADAAGSATFTDPETGYAAYIEVDTFIDHNMLNLLAMNVDALRLSSFYYKTADGKLQAGPIWDFDRSLDSTDSRDNNPRTWFGSGDSTRYFDDSSRVGTWWPDLFQDPDFVQAYIDRWFELRQTTFSNENLFATIDKHAAEIGEAGDRDYDRWSNSRYRDFAGEIAHLKDWLQDRVEWIDSRWQPAPASDAQGNRVPAGSAVNIATGQGTVYYMLDGTDPRGDNGVIRADAKTANGSITIAADTHLVARSFQSGFGGRNGYIQSGDDWSAPLRITALHEPASAANLAITEIHFNPQAADVLGGERNEDNDEFEFLEFTNVGNVAIELEGVQLIEVEDANGDSQGVKFTFEPQSLAPGESIVVVESVEAFQSRYGTGVRIALGRDQANDTLGQYAGKLSNGGERLTLLDATGATIRQFDYDDWYPATDGDGYSLVIRNPRLTESALLSQRTAWRPSVEVNGTPGVADASLPGDFDNSATVDVLDIDLLYAAFAAASPAAEFDLTGDGNVDQADLTYLIEDVLHTKRGDANLDGKVDFADFLVLSANFGKSEKAWSDGDFDGSGSIDFTDFLTLSASFGFDNADD